MLYVLDNPRLCPTVEALVDERYLDASYLDDIDVEDIGIRCRKGTSMCMGLGRRRQHSGCDVVRWSWDLRGEAHPLPPRI